MSTEIEVNNCIIIADRSINNILSTLRQCTIRVSNSLDPDQDRCTVGPDVGLNRLSADDKSRC